MSTQVTVRLREDHVSFLDAQIRQGRAASRAELIDRLLARELRRTRALADLDAIRATLDPDLDSVADATAATPLDLD